MDSGNLMEQDESNFKESISEDMDFVFVEMPFKSSCSCAQKDLDHRNSKADDVKEMV